MLIFNCLMIGAGRGGRTPTGRSPADFESAASASSAIPALDLICQQSDWRITRCWLLTNSDYVTAAFELLQFRTAAVHLPIASSSQDDYQSRHTAGRSIQSI
jgi:hypothetical protein